MRRITLDGRNLSFGDLKAILLDYPPGRTVKLAISPAARKRVTRSRTTIEKALKAGETIYGVNTGFGKLSNTRIDSGHLLELQENLLLSHAAGIGPVASPQTAALVVVLRTNSLAYGNSGVTQGLLNRLVDMFNSSIVPILPEIGSVGASGDLAPLAQLGAVLVGKADALHFKGRKEEARSLRKPYQFKAKEALSLINGVQFSSAVLAETLVQTEEVLKLADIAGTMSLEALRGSVRPFDRRVHAVRPHPGQQAVAKNFRTLLRGSGILDSHRDCKKVQDAYCLRCIPQVHGAVRDAFEFAKGALLREVNSVTDNPLVFENGDVISAGNFHGQPISQAADFLALALASLANIAERRLDRMTNPDLSELPAFLVKESGLNSGYMMVQVAAAAIAAEIRVAAAPASVHSIPTEGGQEDHVSMSAHAARKARQVLDGVRNVLGLEILCAAQGLDFLKPLKPGPAILDLHRRIRREIPSLDRDRYLQPEIRRITSSMFLSDLVEFAERKVGTLE